MIAIRRITKNDYNALLPLQREIAALHVCGRPDLFRAGHINFSPDRFDEFLSNDNSLGLLAEENGKTVGFVFAYIREIINHPVLTDSRILYIDDLCVLSENKGSGIGSMLMDACTNFAHRKDCSRILLDVHTFNRDAIAFYEKIG
ncbi:MAG: GNAT family N-acetyltransferase, partial [Clostridia bacterium]|nr:GNAT family N-acetyltransferase [Clostridia bacterium]